MRSIEAFVNGSKPSGNPSGDMTIAAPPTTMNKLTTTLIATLIGTALFIAAGSGMALAQMAQ